MEKLLPTNEVQDIEGGYKCDFWVIPNWKVLLDYLIFERWYGIECSKTQYDGIALYCLAFCILNAKCWKVEEGLVIDKD